MFEYINKQLCLVQKNKQIPISSIANKYKNPFYLYDLNGLTTWHEEFHKETKNRLNIFFAMKANNSPHVLRTFQKLGSGVDIVSGGEAKLAMQMGFSPDKIIFSGVAKNIEELELAVSKSFFQINVESFEELKVLAQVCQRLKKKAKLGLRLNPNVQVETHPHIQTGLREHKFGIDLLDLPSLLDFINQNKNHFDFQGLSMHIGSQIFNLNPLYQAIQNLQSIYKTLQKQYPTLKTLDIGGGLGFDYQHNQLESVRKLLKEFGSDIHKLFNDFQDSIIIETGRFLIAPFGILCAKIEYIKKTPYKKFIILNSGMNHFLRPALYDAKHKILPLFKDNKDDLELYDVVGPICETGDTFAKNYSLPSSLKAGDFLAIADVGAYGQVMANNYNLQIPALGLSFLDGKELSN